MDRRASRQLIFGAMAAAFAALGGAVSACTVWSGLEVPGPSSGAGDATTADGPPADIGMNDGGSGSDDGAAPFDASGLPTFLDVDDAIRLCSLVATCTDLPEALRLSLALPAQNGNFSACVDLFAGPRPPASKPSASQLAVLHAVVAAAPSCSAVLAALPVIPVAATNPLCIAADGGAIVGARCVPSADGKTSDVVACGDQEIYHCGSAGFGTTAHCLTSPDGSNYDCVAPGNCSTASPCNGDVLQTCDDGVDPDGGIPVYDCSLFGAECVTSALDCQVGGVSAEDCTGQTTQCTDGVTLQICAAGGLDRLQCDTMGALCTKAGAYAYCSIQHSACDQSTASINACDGTSISLCVGGQLVNYDCSKVGLSCGDLTNGTSAACQ